MAEPSIPQELGRRRTSSYLFVLPWSLVQPGGVNHVVLNLAKEMKEAGDLEPIVLTQDWNAVHPQWSEFQGIRTVRWRIRSYRSDFGLRKLVPYRCWEWHFATSFERFCKLHGVVAINAHYVGETSFTLDRLIRGLKLEIPLILSFHGADLRSIADEAPKRVAEWRALFARTIVVACSGGLAQRIATVFGKDIAPVTIHNGISASRFIAADVTDLVPAQRFILNVGTFETKKGQDVLIEALAQIAGTYADLHLVLVGALGANGKKLQELKTLVAQHGLEHRVHFFSDMPHDRLAGFFRSASIFGLPSRDEPFGIVLLEAGVCALPVVASRVGGIPEIISDGETGRLVDPDDAGELAGALRSMLDDPLAAQTMGKRLQQHVLAKFTWRVAYDSYVSLITGVERRPSNLRADIFVPG